MVGMSYQACILSVFLRDTTELGRHVFGPVSLGHFPGSEL